MVEFLSSGQHQLLMIRVFCVLLFAFGTWFVNRRISRGKLSFMLGTVWTLAFVFGALSAMFPAIIFFIGSAVGTVLPVNILYFGAILFLVAIAFGLTLKTSLMNRQIIALSQELALLRLKVEPPCEIVGEIGCHNQ